MAKVRFYGSPLILRDLGTSDQGRPEYELVQPYCVWWRDGAWLSIHVPAGFRTDLASVPRVLWWLFPPAGPWTRAAVVHDWLYSTGGVGRCLADAIFREVMRQQGVPGWQRWLMWAAVRLFGRRAFVGRSATPSYGRRKESLE